MQLYLKKYSFLFLVIILVCCSKDNTNSSGNHQAFLLDSLSQKKVSIQLLSLSGDAERKFQNFTDYQNLHNLMLTFRESNSYFIKKYQDSLDILLFNFRENMAEEELFIKPIRSRVNVITTQHRLLAEAVNKSNTTETDILQHNKKLLEAYNSLLIQLNELSLSIPDNIEQELLKNNLFKKDSIRNESK